MVTDSLINQLLSLSRNLGKTEQDYVILGEGNISGKVDENTFWVKASGTSLGTLGEKDLVQVLFEPVKQLLEQSHLNDDEIKQGLQDAKMDAEITAMPSVETFLHAILLQLAGVNFVGHTHPTAVNSILCSNKAEEAFSGSLFPDQIVYCGPAPLYIPYTDPGLPLAKKVRQEISSYLDQWGQTPKILLMQNHGLIALGKTALEVEHITAMAVKAARVILGAYAVGDPHFLSQDNVDRIYSRPDEKYRKGLWEAK